MTFSQCFRLLTKFHKKRADLGLKRVGELDAILRGHFLGERRWLGGFAKLSVLWFGAQNFAELGDSNHKHSYRKAEDGADLLALRFSPDLQLPGAARCRCANVRKQICQPDL